MATALNERVAFGFIATKGDASRVDASGNGYGPRALIVPITDRDLHFASAADRDTDWNVANPTHPTLYIHSETTPATDYVALYHDGDIGYLNVAGGNIALQTAGTTRLTISSTALTVPDDEIVALGTDGDQAFVNRSTILATNTALTSVMIGTPVTPAVAANSLIISNITASGDILVAGNNGGNSQAWLWIDTSAGTMNLYGAGTAVAIVASTYFEIEDGILFALGTDDDTVLLNRASILNANTALTGAIVGTPVTPAVAANSLILSNITASGDILVAANLAGNSQAWLWVDSSASLMTLYGAGVSAVEIGTNLVINEGSADRDFRIEGDNNANMLVIDAGTDSMSLGRVVIAGAYLAVDGSTVNRDGVTAVARHLHIPSVTVTQTNADPTTLALGAASYVGQTTFAGANANQTITDAASFIVAAAPAAGTNMTFTRSWAAILGGRVGIGLDPTAITHDINTTTAVVFNEQAADIDFRVEGDNNANMLVIDAGTDSAGMGAAVVAGAFLSLDGSAVNRAGVTNVGRGLHMPAATFTQTNADPTTLATGARVVIGVPTFAGSNPNQTITDAASLYIAGIPVAGTNMTLTRAATIVLGREVDHIIVVEGTTTAATVGGALTIRAGVSGTSGTGGAITVSSGAGDTTGAGGLATYTSGAGGGTSGNSGGITIQPGTVTSGAGGAIQILGRAGVASNNTGSTITITAGASIGTGTGGAVNLTAGAGGSTAGVGGAIALLAGNAGGGASNGGAVTITAGNSTGTGTGGAVTVTAGSGSSGQLAPGGALTCESGAGGSSDADSAGGASGNVILRSGAGGGSANAQNGGASGSLTISTGVGGATTTSTGGAGGTLALSGGAGGAASGAGTGGAGASITITAGAGGNGGTASGAAGNVTITAGATGTGGNVNGGTVRLVAGAGVGTGTTGTVGITTGLLNDYRTITTISTDSDVVYTAAQVRTGVINRDSITANRNDSMPTAANLVAGLPGAYVGQSFFFVLNNNDDASTLTMTTAAAGITYDGNIGALAAAAARLYLVVITNVTASAEAATVFGL